MGMVVTKVKSGMGALWEKSLLVQTPEAFNWKTINQYGISLIPFIAKRGRMRSFLLVLWTPVRQGRRIVL